MLSVALCHSSRLTPLNCSHLASVLTVCCVSVHAWLCLSSGSPTPFSVCVELCCPHPSCSDLLVVGRLRIWFSRILHTCLSPLLCCNSLSVGDIGMLQIICQ